MAFKQILFLLTVSNLIALAIIGYQNSIILPAYGISERITQGSLDMEYTSRKFIYQPSYSFSNSSLAYKILKKLDKYEAIEVLNNRTNDTFYGLATDNKYCDNHRKFFTENVDTILKETSFLSDASMNSLLRGVVLPMVGEDMHPGVGPHMLFKKRNVSSIEMKPETSLFLTADNMFEYQEIGKQFSCLTQISNHIPEIGRNKAEGFTPYSKSSILSYLNRYSKKFANKLECFALERFVPTTWDLSDKKQCESFFTKLSEEEASTVYMKRKAVKSNGEEKFDLMNGLEMTRLRTLYEEKKICGMKNSTEKHVIQRYVENPMLLNGSKFNIRVYMLVASTNPIIAYYHDGYLSIAKDKFREDTIIDALNGEAKEKEKVYHNGLKKKEMEKAEKMTFEKFEEHLLQKKKIIPGEDWINKSFRQQLKVATIHVLRAISNGFPKSSSIYELFALDFMMDEEFNLWFLDAEHGDLFTGKTDNGNGEATMRMLEDHLEIVIGLMRSRVRRVVNYVNRLIRDNKVEAKSRGRIKFDNEEQRLLEFQEMSKNYFELDYEPKRTNGFTKIMDGNHYSFQRFNLIMERECLI